MINLRPHHINCIFFYKGLGYSKEFTMNMSSIINKMCNNESKIKFINNLDDLCCKCPNNLGKECITNDKVIDLDNKTVTKYNLDFDKIYNFKDLIKNIYLKYTEEDFEFICSNCQWHESGICCKDIIKSQKMKWLEKMEAFNE